MSYARIFLKFVSLDLSAELKYKLNIVLKFISFITMDFIAPLVALLIYSNTLGIPGWNLYEFFLLQGTMTLILGLGHAFAFRFAWEVMDMVRHGEFDIIMIKPLKPLVYLMLGSFDFSGCAEIFAGTVIIIYSLLHISQSFALVNWLAYIILVLMGVLFQLAVSTFISAMAFIFIKSWALFDIWFHSLNFARYPSTVFDVSIRFMITFIFPVAVTAFYPAATLLGRLSLFEIITPMFAVIVFWLFSLWFWSMAMKKYASAGG